MKQIKTLVIVVIVLLGANQTILSQSKTSTISQSTPIKIAHVDINEIQSKMPAMLDAQKQLEKLASTYDIDFKKMMGEYQAKAKKYEAEAATVTEAINGERAKEVQDLEKRIVDFRDSAQKELEQKKMDILKPLQEKIITAIQKVGRVKGFQYVLEGSSLILAEGTNLTADVKKELGF